MKIKILIVPFLLFLSVVLAIWWINPGYAEMNLKKTELAAARTRLEEIQAKNEKATKLNEIWNTSSAQRNIIAEYLPEQKQEENVIDSLNSLSAQAGVGLVGLEVSKDNSNVFAVAPADAGLVESLDAPSAEPVTTSFNVSLIAVGDYGKIKALLNKVVTLKRFNSIESLEITKASKQGEGAAADESSSGNLQLSVVLTFEYLEKGSANVSVNDRVFVSGNFDLAVADEITKKLTTEVNKVNVGLVGRENPFVK